MSRRRSDPPSPAPSVLRLRGGGPDLAHLEPLLGDVLVEGEIARSPRAAVYRIRAGSLGGKACALKVALLPVEAEELLQFRHEVRLLSELRHPNVVEVYEFGVLPGNFPFLTMELVEGPDLHQFLAGNDWERFYDVALQASAGLAHIHRQGVVHLDVKPQNLGVRLLPEGGFQLKILDFGLSQSTRGPLDRRVRGTLAYVAPEILLQDSYDHRADLYSLGITLFELATGSLPSAVDDHGAIRFHLEGERPDPRALRPDLPPALAAVLVKLLERDPRRRHASAGKLLVDLAAAAGRHIDPAQLAIGEGMVLASGLVGREPMLETLRAALAQAGQGEGSVLLLEGVEGSGKSRLLREFRLQAAGEGARVGLGRAAAHRTQPLFPVLAALKQLGIGLEQPPAEVREQASDEERTLLFREVAAQLALAAEGPAPVVLLLDDLHLADSETQEAVAFLAGEARRSRFLVIGTRRSLVQPPTNEADPLARSEEIVHLELAPLDRRDTARLVEACLGTEELPAALTDWVGERSEGLPARVGSLLRHLIDERVLRFRNGEWKTSLLALNRLAVAPGGTEALDRQRVAALAEPERRALETAAVIGEPFRLELLAEALAVPSDEMYDRLAHLQAQGLIERVEEAGAPLYALAEASTREVLYGGIEPEARRAMHLHLAQLLAARLTAGEEDLASAVAEHYWEAGEHAQALPYLLAAGRAASAVHGHASAASNFARAVEAAAEQGDREGAIAAKVAQAEALTAAGQYGRALKILEELLADEALPGRRAEDRKLRAALALRASRLHVRLGEHDLALAACEQGLAQIEDLDLPELEIDLLHGKASALRDLGHADEGFAAARSALARAGRLGLHRQRAQLLNTLGMAYYARGDWRRAGRLLRRGLYAADLADDDRLRAKLRNNLGNVLWKTGDYAGAFRHYQENLAFCERTRDLWGQLSALNNLGILESSRGNWLGSREPLGKSLELARRLRAREAESLSRLNLAEVEEMLGDWSRARRLNERVARAFADHPDHSSRLSALAQLASLARKRGDHEEAVHLAEEALAGASRIEDHDLVMQCHWLLGLVATNRERWSAAADHLGLAVAAAEAAGTRESFARLRLALSDLALRRGDRAAAREQAAEARRAVELVGDRLALGGLLVLEARLADLDEQGEEAERLFAAGVRLLEELTIPYEYGQALYEWGMRTAHHTQSIERLDRALVAFDRLGAIADAERARGAIQLVRERQRFEIGRRGMPGLYEVAKIINSTLDQTEVLNRSLDLVLARLRAERGMILLWRSLTAELEIAAARNLGAPPDSREGQSLSETVVRRVIEQREAVMAVDALTDPRFAGAESIVASHIVSILCVPMAIRDKLVGAIYVDHCRSRDLFKQKDLEFLVAFADQAAVAIENARLYGELEAKRQRLKAENESLRSEMLSARHLGGLIGKSRALTELKSTLERIAVSSTTVLICGESGTGKGMVARTLHTISPRRTGPFIQFNCAALPETLVESELFGHERGAFTGAIGQKPGRFELAHQGTIFLDEIGNISLGVQAKLLRVVEDQEFERVGGTKTLKSDCRVVAATNLDLEKAIERNEFREDLYYRLNIIPIILPPLRERREDIPYLVQHFLAKICRDFGQPVRDVEPAVLDLFLSYRWPGNVRELEAAIHRALVLSSRDPLTPADFSWITRGEVLAPPPTAVPAAGAVGGEAVSLANGGYERAIERLDRELIARALSEHGGKIREVARVLDIARNTLKAKMKRYGLQGKGE